MAENLRQCKNCLYCEPGETLNICRRHPPQVHVLDLDGKQGPCTLWPEVNDDEFCGEFKTREKKAGTW